MIGKLGAGSKRCGGYVSAVKWNEGKVMVKCEYIGS
jgi:hypothetical protein